LALCAILDAIYAAMNFFTQRQDGSLALRAFVNHRETIVNMGILALAAGACTIVAGLWMSGEFKSWLLVLNGLACSALGLIFTFWTGPLAFHTIAILIAAMAMAIGIYGLASVRIRQGWLFASAGVVFTGFALTFLGFVFHWIRLDPASPTQTFYWMGSYFVFSAIFMLGLALRQHKQDGSVLPNLEAAKASPRSRVKTRRDLSMRLPLRTET
jgi:uncharacterized membrane protein HdeD (DUF308 family)